MEQNVLYSILPIITTLSYLVNDPTITITRMCIALLPLSIPLLLYFRNANCSRLFRSPCIKRGNHIDFTARLRIKAWDEEPNSIIRNFSTVLWEWNRCNETVNCVNLMEESVGNRYIYEDNANISNKPQPIFADDQNTFFWHSARPNIQYRMWVERNTDRDGYTTSELILTMRFLKHTPSAVVEHIEFLKTEAQNILLHRELKQRVLVSIESKDEEKKGPGFMVYEFNTTTSFANFFSEESSTVYKDIQEFQNNKKAYERTGRPWTYTILNEGPPGVGKTKLVKAVAALTGYTLIVINLNHIPNAQVLYEAFHMSSLAGECVPHDKRLYYIPEVDTQIHSILKARDTVTNLVSLEDTKPKKDDKKPNIEIPSTKPTLGEILNVIDGIPERHGHILIMDTNCLKDLDPALIRPGRVDRILSWKPMSSLCVKQYLENYYETSLPKRVSLPNRVLTAAKLQSIVAGSPTLEHCLLTLKN